MITVESIMAMVCKELGLEHHEVISRCRHERVVMARRVISILSRRLTTASYPDIAEVVRHVRRKHATIQTCEERGLELPSVVAMCGTLETRLREADKRRAEMESAA